MESSEYQSFEGEGGKSEEEWIQNTLHKVRLFVPTPIEYKPREDSVDEVDPAGNKLVPIELSKSLADSLYPSEMSESEVIFRQAQAILNQ